MTSEPSKSDKGSVTLVLHVPMPPSHKNRKRPVIHSKTGKLHEIIEPSVKDRMQHLEDAILSALYSASQIVGKETHSECWKRLRTVLSGLSDDSIREIPCGSWDVEYVSKGSEGISIHITEL